ncbi:hypothetical protein GCM10011325_11990 [Dyadobacter sediminis]|nr:hypothetical protein GCM10011325_11990 [Dyadobacter sediminis]
MNSSSNLREGVGGITLAPEIIPTTEGTTCYGCAAGWQVIGLPFFGISNTQYLFGDITRPWVYPLDVPPTGTGTFLTIGAKVTTGVLGYSQTNLKNLKEGKKYKFKFSVSTSSIKTLDGETPLSPTIALHGAINTGPIELGNNPGKWITKTVTFTATQEIINGSKKLIFAAWPKSPYIGSSPAYANIHIPKHAVVEIN